jgi:citrate lyase subunit beta/citryl-CoA lyase
MSEKSKIRPRRSVLYLPASNQRALDKAKTLATDALILDLEDSVAPGEKTVARNQLAQALAAGGYGRRELVVRINDPVGPWGTVDLAMAARAEPDAILIPKVNNAGDVSRAREAINAANANARTKLWAMIETPMGILKAGEIGAAGREQGLDCLIIGTNDIVKETRASAANGRAALLPWLSQIVLAARASGIDVIDGVYNDFSDKTGFVAECEQGKALGMDGKTLIHPNQIGPCNEIFSPAESDVEWAQRVIEAFKLPENESRGVITVEGKMVERLHLAMAERVIAVAEAAVE